ncbi:conserved protein of unknown function (plasmid) [Rhodovastum atsumiense]|uniref:Uncharacterized protein n=1 Tax=Rhodovastum atsumiense TaxID=504468 RepID=A0A5M6ITB0_9PROT|nr:hypothetical protein [Rhodovastum atsumiense]KAA5611554.1 hypothetical protein F1189_13395 [Rhodovastum atsumiense]CAH2606218.1 conserved protein of unknown function [Rhodovastum atsumiense]
MLAIRGDLKKHEWFGLTPEDADAWADALRIAAQRARGQEPGAGSWLALLHPDGREVSAAGYYRVPKPAGSAIVPFPEPREDWGIIAFYAEFDAEEGGRMIGRAMPLVLAQAAEAVEAAGPTAES